MSKATGVLGISTNQARLKKAETACASVRPTCIRHAIRAWSRSRRTNGIGRDILEGQGLHVHLERRLRRFRRVGVSVGIGRRRKLGGDVAVHAKDL